MSTEIPFMFAKNPKPLDITKPTKTIVRQLMIAKTKESLKDDKLRVKLELMRTKISVQISLAAVVLERIVT